jgi:hypothetical protein
MDPLKRTARLAGFLYLLVVLAGPFLLIYFPNKLFVPGDALATASNILAHETLFRVHMVLGIATELVFVATVLVLYRLLKGVNAELAAVMVILVLIDAPLAFLSVANEAGTIAALRAGGVQHADLATLLLTFDQQGVFVREVFWGLWLLPLGLLVYRSVFLPRFLGVWLFINGLAYVALSAIGLAAPDHYNLPFKLATPILFGEVALMLWLLIVGVRPRPAVMPQLDVVRRFG